MKIYVSDDIYEYLAIGKRNIHSGVDDDLVVKSLEQHYKEIRKPLEDEINELKDRIKKLKTANESFANLIEAVQEITERKDVCIDDIVSLRNHERQKVIAELEEWAENEHKMYIDDLVRFVGTSKFYGTSVKNRLAILEDLKQKLNEMKGEK